MGEFAFRKLANQLISFAYRPSLGNANYFNGLAAIPLAVSKMSGIRDGVEVALLRASTSR
jgi:hypothetical protein